MRKSLDAHFFEKLDQEFEDLTYDYSDEAEISEDVFLSIN